MRKNKNRYKKVHFEDLDRLDLNPPQTTTNQRSINKLKFPGPNSRKALGAYFNRENRFNMYHGQTLKDDIAETDKVNLI